MSTLSPHSPTLPTFAPTLKPTLRQALTRSPTGITVETVYLSGLPMALTIFLFALAVVCGACICTYPYLAISRWRLRAIARRYHEEEEEEENEDEEEPPPRRAKSSTALFGGGRKSEVGRWVERTDPSSGSPYYEHTGTGEVTWTDPRPPRLAAKSKKAIGGPPPGAPPPIPVATSGLSLIAQQQLAPQPAPNPAQGSSKALGSTGSSKNNKARKSGSNKGGPKNAMANLPRVDSQQQLGPGPRGGPPPANAMPPRGAAGGPPPGGPPPSGGPPPPPRGPPQASVGPPPRGPPMQQQPPPGGPPPQAGGMPPRGPPPAVATSAPPLQAAPPPAAPPAAPPAQPAAPAAPAGGLKADPKFEKYNRMTKAGLPQGAIRNAMNRDGIPEDEVNKYFES